MSETVRPPVKVLIVKLSSLGDVLHTMPAVQDIRRAFPNAQIDWVVEGAFAGIVQRCQGVNRVIACDLRKWRKSVFSAQTRREWRACKAALQQESYDAVIDAQGLTKSAFVAWMAKLTPNGKRYAMANRTKGSSFEAPTRWVADVAIALPPHIHAVQRARALCAGALAYVLPENSEFYTSFGLVAIVNIDNLAIDTIVKSDSLSKPEIVFAHGSSRDDKLWPVSHWVELGQRLSAQGYGVALAHGSDVEEQRSHVIAEQLTALGVQAVVWPRLGLDALTDALATSGGVVGVDSGLSHIAVALNLPHVQIYNFDTAWRTGPASVNAAVATKQISVFAQPTPTVDAVWTAWLSVKP